MSEPSPIGQLMRLASDIEAGRPVRPDDSAYVVAAIRTYVHQAPEGMSMEKAFGLAPGQGHSPWWVEGARRTRDDLIRLTHFRFFEGVEVAESAKAIANLQQRVFRRGKAQADLRAKFLLAVPAEEAKPLHPRTIKQILGVK
jgi:hypothetical protein